MDCLFYCDCKSQNSYAIANYYYRKPVNEYSSVQFFIDNIFNEKADLYINNEDEIELVTINRPRTIVLKYSWKFN